MGKGAPDWGEQGQREHPLRRQGFPQIRERVENLEFGRLSSTHSSALIQRNPVLSWNRDVFLFFPSPYDYGLNFFFFQSIQNP
ncbi:hypothetical protein BBFGKLBO_00268 [Synechococcus sp. CBW1107]|nr:hypothetical protein BBFGKLBO_00268 [Synechococcus sp. CBW1107]